MKTSGLSVGASASGGVRLAGTARTSAEAATAACTWSVSRCRTASSGRWVGAADGVVVDRGALASIRGVRACAPCPTGGGTTASATRHAHTPAAVRPAPSSTLRPGARRRRPNRTGFSRATSVPAARTPESAAAASRPPSPSPWPTTTGASSSTGQCHRYQE